MDLISLKLTSSHTHIVFVREYKKNINFKNKRIKKIDLETEIEIFCVIDMI